MSYSISRDFLYFLLWFIEAIKAPPFTFRVALYSLNLCKIVEYLVLNAILLALSFHIQLVYLIKHLIVPPNLVRLYFSK
jgi:hypothetical protein